MQVQDDKPYDDINITPMLDLAYVLLVIFILMTTASVQGMKVNLPKASNSPSKSKAKPVAIVITKEGNILMNNNPVTLTDLEQRLTQAKASTPDLSVIVRGDSKTQYQAVINVIDVLGRLSISQVGLATAAPSK